MKNVLLIISICIAASSFAQRANKQHVQNKKHYHVNVQSSEKYISSRYSSHRHRAFTRLIQSLKFESSRRRKIEIVRSISESRIVFSLNQVRRVLNEFSFSSDKLKVAKLLYRNTRKRSKAMYYTLVDELNFRSEKEDLLTYISRGNNMRLEELLGRNISSRKKMEMIEKASESYMCFNLKQVKRILNELTFSSDKLRAAKLLYKRTRGEDRMLYYTLMDELTFNSEREELFNYISSCNSLAYRY